MVGTVESPLLITHIPKTAGTSLRNVLAKLSSGVVQIYGGELALASPDIEFIRRFRASPKPRAVMGHFSYGIHRLLGVPPRYAAVFREPTERIISLYRHQKRSPSPQYVDRMNADMSLEDFVYSAITEMTNNHMCRIIAGIPPESGLIINADWLLDLAIHNLQRHFEIVGTVDQFEKAIEKFSHALDLGGVVALGDNVSRNARPELNERTMQVLREFNELDFRLYDFVVRQRCGRASSLPAVREMSPPHR